jgi:hypothetical protein
MSSSSWPESSTASPSRPSRRCATGATTPTRPAANGARRQRQELGARRREGRTTTSSPEAPGPRARTSGSRASRNAGAHCRIGLSQRFQGLLRGPAIGASVGGLLGASPCQRLTSRPPAPRSIRVQGGRAAFARSNRYLSSPSAPCFRLNTLAARKPISYSRAESLSASRFFGQDRLYLQEDLATTDRIPT